MWVAAHPRNRTGFRPALGGAGGARHDDRMRFQDRQHTCGPASLRNALHLLGIRGVTQGALAELAGTTWEGTDQDDLIGAIRALELVPTVVTSEFGLRGALAAGRPVLCAVTTDDPYDHWITAIGLLGERLIVCDPADNELVFSITREAWRRWWSGPEGFYGIAIGKWQ